MNGRDGARSEYAEKLDKACRWAAAGASLLLVLAAALQPLLANDNIRRHLSAVERLEGHPFPVVPFLHRSP